MNPDGIFFEKLKKMSAIEFTKEEEQRLYKELAPLIDRAEKIMDILHKSTWQDTRVMSMRPDDMGGDTDIKDILKNAPTVRDGFFFLQEEKNEK